MCLLHGAIVAEVHGLLRQTRADSASALRARRRTPQPQRRSSRRRAATWRRWMQPTPKSRRCCLRHVPTCRPRFAYECWARDEMQGRGVTMCVRALPTGGQEHHRDDDSSGGARASVPWRLGPGIGLPSLSCHDLRTSRFVKSRRIDFRRATWSANDPAHALLTRSPAYHLAGHAGVDGAAGTVRPGDVQGRARGAGEARGGDDVRRRTRQCWQG